MSSHVIYSPIDPAYPGTLSRAILDDLLRKRLRFDGLVMSDDMQMKAITDGYGLQEACCKALAAGIDLLIIGNNLTHDPGILQKTKNAVLEAVSKGEISEQRIEEAYCFVQKFKLSLRCHHTPK